MQQKAFIFRVYEAQKSSHLSLSHSRWSECWRSANAPKQWRINFKPARQCWIRIIWKHGKSRNWNHLAFWDIQTLPDQKQNEQRCNNWSTFCMYMPFTHLISRVVENVWSMIPRWMDLKLVICMLFRYSLFQYDLNITISWESLSFSHGSLLISCRASGSSKKKKNGCIRIFAVVNKAASFILAYYSSKS